MDNFNIIYKILKALEKAMDLETFDGSLISYDVLNISEVRWKKIIKILVDENYIDGVRVIDTDTNGLVIKMFSPTITLQGLEYLNDNSFMKKAAQIASGVSVLIPKL
ncbi:MAG: YjcQ family protein [Clostridium sp.]